MQERDHGVYEALCTSKYGEARQKVILRMSEPPRFLQHPEETTVMQREQARFEARVTGVPMPQVTGKGSADARMMKLWAVTVEGGGCRRAEFGWMYMHLCLSKGLVQN